MHTFSCLRSERGQSLVEVLMAMGILALMLPALMTGFFATRQGRVQQRTQLTASHLMQEGAEAVRSIRENGWSTLENSGTFHPVVQGVSWTLAGGPELIGDFSRQVVISDVYRDATGNIVDSGGELDPSTRRVVTTVSWNSFAPRSVSSTQYLTRYLDNLTYEHSSEDDFSLGDLTQSAVVSQGDGAVQLATNDKARWCAPEYSATSIDLPDGPPVAVAATASAATTAVSNDVFVAVAPEPGSSTKMAYVNVPANIDPPQTILQGIFTLDPAKYSSPGMVPTGLGFDNNFRTNAISYYRSESGGLYALIGTTLPHKEVIVVEIKNSVGFTWQDVTNQIYRYKTFFNTRRYQGDTASQPNQDHSPYGYGASSISVLDDRAYVLSGGYLYVVNLANIDTKSASNGLDMVGCRIELDGMDCNPSINRQRKYGSGNTGTNWNILQSAQPQCMDGGAQQLYAANDTFPVKVGANTYVYVAVGNGADPELNIINVTNVPSGSTSPTVTNNNCGRISGGNSGWKRISSLDFNAIGGTQESSNSVYGNKEGTRAYIASNGGVDGNNDGKPDSHQLYVVDTSNKSSPRFLSGSASSGGPTSGYYSGDASNIQMFPRRSMTVLNGKRIVLVGNDGIADSTNPLDYQVLNVENEAAPQFCGGLEFDDGFNDLTSVTEADFDNYVYMVTNTQDKQLKIIQGGPDGTYVDQGTFTSEPIDAGFSTTFNRYTATFSQPAGTSLKFQFAGAEPVDGSCQNANYFFVGPNGESDTYYTDVTSPIYVSLSGHGAYRNPARCFRYKAFFQTTDFNATAVLEDMTINYSP